MCALKLGEVLVLTICVANRGEIPGGKGLYELLPRCKKITINNAAITNYHFRYIHTKILKIVAAK